jgi:hypothetical protein
MFLHHRTRVLIAPQPGEFRMAQMIALRFILHLFVGQASKPKSKRLFTLSSRKDSTSIQPSLVTWRTSE